MLRCGVIGVGYWGRNYVRVITDSGAASLAAIGDPSPQALAAVQADVVGLDLTVTDDPDAVLHDERVDAVVVATPATTHFDLVREALRSGKHVLCEKPLAMSVPDCCHLVAVAEEAGKTLLVGHTFVYNPAVVATRDLVASGELGDSLHFHAVWTAPGPIRTDVNALWDLAPHPISIVTYLTRRRARTVTATAQTLLAHDREDVGALHLRVGEGVTADIYVSWLAPRKTRCLTITGGRGVAVFDDMAGPDKLRIYRTDGAELRAGSGRDLALVEAPAVVPAIPAAEPLAAQFRHFVECCAAGVTPRGDGLSGDYVVAVLEAADASLRDAGRPVPLDETYAVP